MTPDLPPAPDRFGHPRPPAAPAVAIASDRLSEVTSTHHALVEGRRRALVGGDTTSPLLESATQPRRASDARVLGVPVGLAALPVGALALSLAVSGAGVGAALAAVVAVALLGWSVVAVLGSPGGDTIEVGARTIAVRPRDADVAGQTVDLYLLSEVAIRETADGPVLDLRQWLSGLSREVGVCVPCDVLEGNAEAWALVYLGIRHSEAAGAAIDARTRSRLELPRADVGCAAAGSDDDRDGGQP